MIGTDMADGFGRSLGGSSEPGFLGVGARGGGAGGVSGGARAGARSSRRGGHRRSSRDEQVQAFTREAGNACLARKRPLVFHAMIFLYFYATIFSFCLATVLEFCLSTQTYFFSTTATLPHLYILYIER